jgi:hypothetical protein
MGISSVLPIYGRLKTVKKSSNFRNKNLKITGYADTINAYPVILSNVLLSPFFDHNNIK